MPDWFMAASAVVTGIFALCFLLITIDVINEPGVDPRWFPIPAAITVAFIYATFYLGANA